MPDSYKGKTCGLCGNFNDNHDDDFQTKGGKATTSVTEFGNSWQAPALGKTCKPVPPTKPVYPTLPDETKDEIDYNCEKLKGQRAFKPCHSVVDPHHFIEQCREDLARCDKKRYLACMCDSFTQYSRQCTRKGVTLSWRSASQCRK